MIFLHGGPGFRDYLQPFFGDLGECYDQVGTSIEDLVAQLDEKVGERREVLVGHSWGGVLAMEFARRHPARVRALVLMSTCLSSTQWKVPNVTEENLLTSAELAIGRPFLDRLWETFSDETFAGLEPYLRTFEFRDRKWEMPVLHLYGREDGRFPIHDLGLRSCALNGTGHFPFLLQGDACRRLILSFLVEHGVVSRA